MGDTRMLVLLLLCALVCVAKAMAADCKYNWTIQPPTDLNCNPLYTNITLSCGVEPMIIDQTFITWFWIDKNCTEAMVQPSENYAIQPNDSNSSLSFFVTPNHMGYYWCQVQVDNTTVNSSISSILKLSNSYPCDETSILNLHNRRECVNNTSHMRNTCKPIQDLPIAPVVVPMVVAFITLLVLWCGILIHAYNNYTLLETPGRPASQQTNRLYSDRIPERETSQFRYIDNQEALQEMDNQIQEKNPPEHNEPTKTSELYNKKPADYLQPVKSCEVQVGKASSLETQTKVDAFNKSEEVAVHVHVSGNPQNTVQI